MNDFDPKVVEIGELVWACYEKENKPAGFGMLHASRGSNPDEHDTRIVYLSPVAYEVCRQAIGERYTLEACNVPACDEPNIIWVFGDPIVMGQLKDKWEPEAEKAQTRHAGVAEVNPP
jgi:hypothetical protein